MPLFRPEEHGCGEEMGVAQGPLRRWALIGQTTLRRGDVGHQVPWEADDLLEDQAGEGVDGRVLGHVFDLLHVDAHQRRILGFLWRDVVVVFGEVIGVDMVAAVGGLPAEVGGQEEGVQDPADGVVDVVVGGEGAVAAFVAEDLEIWVSGRDREAGRGPYPDAGQLLALVIAVGSPCGISEPSWFDLVDLGVGDVCQC